MAEAQINVVSCPVCSETKRAETLETRQVKIGVALTNIRRKRCTACSHQFKTVEVPIEVGREIYEED